MRRRQNFMSTIKIVHVVEALGGGVYTYFKNLTHVLCEHPELEVTVIYSANRTEIDPQRVATDFHPKTQLIELSMQREIRLKDDIKAFKQLRKLFKEHKPDVLHLHSSKAGILGRFAYRLSWLPKTKLFYTPHGFSFLRKDISALKRFAFWSIEFLSQKFSGGTFIACGDTECLYAKKLGPAVLVRNSIDLNTVKPNLEEKNKHIKRIGTLGRITYARNPKLFNALALNHPKLEFIWIGDGELKHLLTAPNITITGWFTQYASGIEALKQLDVYVQTSLWEGLPIAVLEASARKIPVLATHIIGNKDIIAPGKTGYLFKTTEEFEEVLKKLKPLEVRQKMGINAANRTTRLFNSRVNFEKLIAIYRS